MFIFKNHFSYIFFIWHYSVLINKIQGNNATNVILNQNKKLFSHFKNIKSQVNVAKAHVSIIITIITIIMSSQYCCSNSSRVFSFIFMILKLNYKHDQYIFHFDFQ